MKRAFDTKLNCICLFDFAFMSSLAKNKTWFSI